MKATLLGLALVLAAPTARLNAQSDEEAVMKVVTDLFDAMREGDSAKVRALFHPDARLMTTGMREGTPFVGSNPINVFIEAVGRPHDDLWDEQVYRPTIEISDNLASVWIWYTFHLGERLSHCGVDAFQLARTESGWQIIALADTRRFEGCDEIANP